MQLQNSMAKQRLLVLRNEFIHLGYAFYLTVFLELVKQKVGSSNGKPALNQIKDISEKLEKRKADFSQIREYKSNIDYLFNLLKNEISSNLWNKDAKVKKIFNSKEVVLSKFAYETLHTMLNNKHFKLLHKAIIDKKIQISLADSQKKEAYISQNLFDRTDKLSEINQTNMGNYVTGMSRDLFNFISKLEDIFQKKQSFQIEKLKKDIRVFPKKELFDPKAKFPIEKSSDTFLSRCPEYKNKYLVDFGKAYLNRRIVDKENDPSIMRLDLGDSEFKVSVVETNVNLKVLLLGYLNGKIKVILLYKVNSSPF